MSDEVRPDQGGEGYEWEGEPDLTSISEDELKARLKDLDEEKRALSYRRRVLQGRIDLIRAELVWRGGVLMGGESNRFGRTEGEGGV
ncbi:MAG TPA: hypothetical protein VF558_10810 [Rubrobacteraceae bacterium]|jgi:hypothetical protein